MVLYKYCCPKRLEPLRDKTLRITQFNQLNDPLDCLPVVSVDNAGAHEVWKESALEVFERHGGTGGRDGTAFQEFLRTHAASEQVVTTHIRKPPAECFSVLETSRAMQDEMSKTWGVVCLSSASDSLLMWSHYADQHRGYVIGIDPSGLEMANAGYLPFARFKPVVYQPERVLATNREDDFDFLYAKSCDWRYEEEWRIVLRLDTGTNHPTKPRVWVRDFGAQNLREIILGYRADDKVLLKEVARIRAGMPGVRIRRARPSAILHEMIMEDV